jgi:hypothetical protein
MIDRVRRAVPRARTVAIAGVVTLWSVLLFGGLALFSIDQSRQGTRGTIPARWPGASRIHRAAGQPTLLVFLHPNCPCSIATVHSLQRSLRALRPEARPKTVFVVRPAVRDDWRARQLLATAAETPNGSFFQDDGEKEIARFGADVSGHLLLYGPAGALLFDGGVTPERGQEAESMASDRFQQVLTGMPRSPVRTAVFGCGLQSHRSAREKRCTQ